MFNDPPPTHWLNDSDENKPMMTATQIEGIADLIASSIMKCLLIFSAISFFLGMLVGWLL